MRRRYQEKRDEGEVPDEGFYCQKLAKGGLHGPFKITPLPEVSTALAIYKQTVAAGDNASVFDAVMIEVLEDQLETILYAVREIKLVMSAYGRQRVKADG